MSLDTAPVLDDPAPRASTDPSVTPRVVWRVGRVPIVIGTVLLLAAGVVALTTGRIRGGFLTPDGTRPAGGRALAQLLVDHDVDVVREDVPVAAPDTTTFVPVPDRVDPAALAALLNQPGHDLVLVSPSPEYLDELAASGAPAVLTMNEVDLDERPPDCAEEVAVTAGVVRLGGYVYRAPPDGEGCYPAGGGSTLVVVRSARSRLVLLGSGRLFTNERLDEEGNAALGLGLLGRHGTVHWVLPRPGTGPAATGQTPLSQLLPQRLKTALWGLVVAVALLAISRARRLGRLVVEPLPVVVRAAESVEGRARLYRSANARGRAGESLRSGTRDRLVRSLGLRPDATPTVVVGAVAAHSRRPGTDLELLLYGRPPSTDAELVRLAANLDNLEREVRRQ